MRCRGRVVLRVLLLPLSIALLGLGLLGAVFGRRRRTLHDILGINHAESHQAMVRFEDVGFGYDADGAPTLHDIDLVVPPGARVAIVGETGSGKTTLGYLVARLYDTTSGRVSIDGVDIRDLSFASLARAVGLVSQETYLFHATIRENLRFAKPDASDEEVEAAAQAAQIHGLISTLPDGYILCTMVLPRPP